MEIKGINPKDKSVSFDDGKVIDLQTFKQQFYFFLQQYNAGISLVPSDMEHFMRRTSSKNLKLLMDGKKMEGYQLGTMDKMLTHGQKIALATVITIIFVGLIVYMILHGQGII